MKQSSDWVTDFLKARPQYREFVDLIVLPPTLEEVQAEYPECSGEPELAAGEIRFAKNAHDGHGHGLTVLAWYLISRRSGTPHNFAMMLATAKAPGIETTDTFWAGRERFDQSCGELYANTVKAGFARKGINLKNGDEYCPALVRPDMGFGPKNPDPEAIVPFSDARGYIKKLCQQRGWECNGAVTTKHQEPLRDPRENKIPIAPSVVDNLAIQMCRDNPDLQHKTKDEVRAMVRDKHAHRP